MQNPSMTPGNAEQLIAMLRQAMAAHQRGQLGEAEQLYRRVLSGNKDQFEALHFLGVLESQRGRYEEARQLMSRSLQIDRSKAEAFSNYARVLMAMRRYDEALAACGDALKLRPDLIEALLHRANALRELRRFDEALAGYQRVLTLQPGNADALFGEGTSLLALGRPADALARFERALAARPNHVDAFNNRGAALHALKRHEEAIASYDRALALKADHAEAMLNRAASLVALKRYDEALAGYDRALAAVPQLAEAHSQRAHVFTVLGRYGEAAAGYERALAIDPNHAEALNLRGSALVELGQVDAAIASLKRALAIRPSFGCHTDLIFAMNFASALTTVELQAERARWNELYAAPLAPDIRPHANDRDPDRRLRVGYMSGNFRHQAGTYAFGGVLMNHDPQAFEVFCYSDTTLPDDVTELLRGRAHVWRDVVGRPDAEVAELVRADRIDVLVDTAGHMGGHRLLVFARKPAPVQVTGWGEPTGTGLKTMDYLLADPVLVPESERPLLAEKVFDLPNFLGYWRPDTLPEPNPLPAKSRGYVTFGSFNRLPKIQDHTLRRWAAILRALPTARLMLKADQAMAGSSERQRLDRILADEGIATERVTVFGRTDRANHFTAYHEIDVALDPSPHGGGMTTLDALWMGVPVITAPGATISSRLAAASLTALGLAEFIAPDPDAYVRRAVAVADDLDAIARLRASLRGRMSASAIGDPARYARAVEAAYREMWRRWCASR